MSADNKRKALETIFAKLEKLLPHLGNDNRHEAAVALGKINKLLSGAKLDWHDLIGLLVEQGPPLLDLLNKLFATDDQLLIKLGLAGGKFFHSRNGMTHADIRIDGHHQTLAVAGSEFAEWLIHQFYRETKKAPKPGALKSAIRTLSAHARHDGEQGEVFLRAAHVDGKIYFDIGDPDWTVVEIDQSGWKLIEGAPARFRRIGGMTALPIPERGGSIDLLRPLVNLDSDGFTLFVSWIVDALCPATRPHPVLYLAGEEGSAKSTAAKIAGSLFDPNTVPLRNMPTTVRDLFVAANGSHSLAFDNISTISAAISDGLCEIATGSGFGTRKLYTDTAQILIGGSRPVILNGLLNAINRSDLADRAVVISLMPISSSQRFSEREIWTKFEVHRARIFGALLDCVARGLRQLPDTHLDRLPRLADFALWSVATGAFAPGVFIKAFESAATDANEAIAEADPVAVAVSVFMMHRATWVGASAELLALLTNHDHAEAAPSLWASWPKEPSSFGKRLRTVSAVLRKMGVSVEVGKATDRSRTRTIFLSKIEASNRPIRPNRPKETAEASSASDTSDSTDTSDGKLIRWRPCQ
jgi:hypothetical protein